MNNNTYLISIVIPVYNVALYIRQCLESVVNQTYSNLEIIIVNDGSTDTSLEIIHEYCALDKRIHLISQKNQGISAARNKGISNATGAFMIFVDSDDWLHLDTCKLAMEEFHKTKAEVVIFSYIKEYNQKSEFKYLLEAHTYFDRLGTQKLVRRLLGLCGNELKHPEHADSLVTVWGKMYTTKNIKKNKLSFVDCAIIGTAEDMLFNIHYFNTIGSAVYIHNCLYHYRKNNSSSFTSIYKKNLKQQWYILFDKVQAFMIANNLSGEYQKAFNNRVAFSIIGLGINEMAAPVSFFKKLQNLKAVISDSRYRKAIESLPIKFFPLHWKLFFLCVKYRFLLGIFIMLIGIKFIINKNN